MNECTTVLVVDDDESIVELLKDFLEHERYRVLTACGSEEALAAFRQHAVDCVIADVMMPGQDGYELCRRIRAESGVPILFLSARSDDVDKIRGLTLGGDDYIVKSASVGEIVARVKAVLRRTGEQRKESRSILEFGRLKIDRSAREVFVDGAGIALTPREYELLCLFAENPKVVFPYDRLIGKFWDGVGDKHTIRVHLSRLRDKIEPEPNRPRYLINVWGVGYRFEGG